jgi:hypothetical protein
MTRNTALIAVQTAINSALSDDETLNKVITGVYDARPTASAVTPYITIDAPSEKSWDTFGTLGQIVTYQVNVWWDVRDAKSSLGVKEIIGMVNDVLDDTTLEVEGYEDSVKVSNTMSTDFPDPDEKHWHGVMLFTIWVTQA